VGQAHPGGKSAAGGGAGGDCRIPANQLVIKTPVQTVDGRSYYFS
jgi:hypothetical protein